MIYRLDSQAFRTELGNGPPPPGSSSPAAVASAAAEGGDARAIAEFLRGEDGDADARNPQTGHTLLWSAALGGHAGVVGQLAEAGADYDTCYSNIDDPFTGTTVWRQCSPLWLSVHCGHTAVTKLLLDLGADPEQTNQPFRMAECHGGRESRARTPFFHACCIGNLEAVSLLAGLVDINATNAHDGLTAFWASACMGHESICRLLYAAGADPSSTPHRSTHAAHVGASSLWVACEQGRTEVVYLLASLGLHDEEAERLESHPRGTAEDAARCNCHDNILSYLELLRTVEPTKSLCAAHQRLSLAKFMNPRLSSTASSTVYSLPPDLVETVSHVLLRGGWCPGGGLVRRTIALQVEVENRTNVFDVARSRAAVTRTIAEAAQSRADAAAAELARCEDTATLAAANAAQCTVMATSALQLLEQSRQPALKLVEATAVSRRMKAEATAATKSCGDLAARSIIAESSPSIEASVQAAVEVAAAAQTAAATAEARTAALAEAARIAEPQLRQAEHAAQMAVAEATSASDHLVASKQKLQEMRQPMVQALEAQAVAAAAELASIEAERSLQVCTAGAAAARQAEIVEHIAIRSRALRKENRAVLAIAERDTENAGWLPIDDEQGMYYYNARTGRRTRAKPQALQELCNTRQKVLTRQQAHLLEILPAIGLNALGSVALSHNNGSSEHPKELNKPQNWDTSTSAPAGHPIRTAQRDYDEEPAQRARGIDQQRHNLPPQEDTSLSEELEDSPPGTPPSENRYSPPPSACSSSTGTVWVGGFSGVLWDGPLPPLFIRHSVQQTVHVDAPTNASAHNQFGPRASSSTSSSSAHSLMSSAASICCSSDDQLRSRGGSELSSQLQQALINNEQLAVVAAAARAKSAQLLMPSVLGQRMEWLECLKQGRPPHRNNGGIDGSNQCSATFQTSDVDGCSRHRAGRGRSSRHNPTQNATKHPANGEMMSLDLCRVD